MGATWAVDCLVVVTTMLCCDAEMTDSNDLFVATAVKVCVVCPLCSLAMDGVVDETSGAAVSCDSTGAEVFDSRVSTCEVLMASDVVDVSLATEATCVMFLCTASAHDEHGYP